MTAIETSEPTAGADTEQAAAPAPSAPAPAPPGRERTVTLTIAAFASLAAGAIHATAIGSHAGLPDVVTAFTITAAFQLGWGAGWESKTVVRTLRASGVVDEVVRRYRLDRGRGHGGEFPATRHLVVEQRRPLMPLGWVHVDMHSR